MFVENTMLIEERKTGKKYECFPQIVDINFDGNYRLRYNIGINGNFEWTNKCCIYDNGEFNKKYKVIKERI